MVDRNPNSGSSSRITLVPGLESMGVVHIPQFLSEHERDALFDAACANRQAFYPPGGPGSKAVGSWYLSPDAERGRVDPALSACNDLSKRIEELLPELFTSLGVDSFPVPDISLSIVNGLNGHCGIPHTDASGGRFKISLLYYLHRTPKKFCGGDLEFYNANPTTSTGHSDKPISKIDHEDNLLIAFPSHVFHGITEVKCESQEFADGRFAIIGFLGPQ